MAASEIVVGIDFGTTYSGVSWAVNAGNKTVNLITNWPDPYARNSNNEKVPSKLSYDKNGKTKWGYTAGTVDVIKWMKILLEPTHDYAKDAAVVNAKKLLARLNKTAEEVVAEYLKELWNYAVKEIARKKGDEWRSIYKLRVVLTVPAVWTAGAKARTLQAAKKAGMPDGIQLVAEPEAAALAVLRDKSELKDLEVGDTFVVCDAGGGTVDLISYEVLNLEPLQVKETAVGGGDLCGSVYLDAAFERHIAFLVGNAQYENIESRRKNQMLDAFELGVKRCFDDQDGDDDFNVDLIGVEDDEENGIFGDTITVKRNALKTIFDTVFLQIEKLVSDQLSQIKAKGLTAKAIFLVGGFGESRYLYNRLKACHRGDGISVLGVTSAWSAICRGATLWGLEHSDLLKPEANLPTVSSRLSRHSYGVSLSPIFDPKKHLLIDKYTDGLGIDRANRQMTWYLRRGEEIIEGQKLDKPFSCLVQEMAPDDSDEIEFTHDLLYCPENEAPTREIATVGTYVTVSWKMPCSMIRAQPEKGNVETGEKFYILSFVSNIRLDSTTMDFSVTFKNKTVGAVTTNYKDKFD